MEEGLNTRALRGNLVRMVGVGRMWLEVRAAEQQGRQVWARGGPVTNQHLCVCPGQEVAQDRGDCRLRNATSS